MSPPYPYFVGVSTWLALWGLGFAVSALLARIRVQATPRGWAILLVRDIAFGLGSLLAWIVLDHPRALVPPAPRGLEWPLLGVAALATLLYLAIVIQRGSRPVDSAMLFEQRRYELPLRILTFVFFQQSATTLFLLDWNRLWLADSRAILLTAALFSLSHLAVVTFRASIAFALTLTALTALAMTMWGYLRIEAGMAWAPWLLHYLFYICLAWSRNSHPPTSIT